MTIDYAKLIALIEERQQKNPEAAAALGALIMDVNTLLAVANAADGPTPEALMELWNNNRAVLLPECKKLTEKRRKAARARLRQYPNPQDWRKFIGMINNNPFMLGQNKSRWTANFDWFIKEESMVKFIEGRYNNLPAAAPVDSRRELDDRS